MKTIIWSLVFLGLVGFFVWQVWGRFKILLLARRDDARDYSAKTLGARVKNLVVYGLLQKKFFVGEQPAGILHVVVFWAFLVLGAQVTTMFLRGWFPDFTLPLMNTFVGSIYGFLKDLFQVTVIVGVMILMYRWLVSKPRRLMGILPAEKRLHDRTHYEAILILSFIGTIMISGFFYDGGRAAADPSNLELQHEIAYSPVTRWVAGLFDGRAIMGGMASELAWWIHNCVVLVFLNLLPRSKHFHIITSLPNTFLTKVEAKGHLPKRDFTVETPLFGRSKANDFTWKQILDMFSCTECGRCSAVCPAAATGKPLAPRQFLLDLRDDVYAKQSTWISKKAAGAEPEFEVVVGEGRPVIDEVVWSCVQCRACEQACPVNIEYVDKIVDIRQHLTQEASRFPAELNRTFKGLETQSNPWGISPDERDAWAEGLEVPRVQDNPGVEYIYYVGCGGSFDSNNRKVTQSLVKILKKAGVNFAILGKEELCNGETARRLGNEYLYQTMAEALVGVLNNYKAKKILVNCPHCFNTLAKEYPDFGGHYEVIRAADLVSQLQAQGKIPMAGTMGDKKIVYHDSCNYGRFNGIYDEPRELMKKVPGTRFEEIMQSRENGTCCGAGGGRMWMEEPKDQRVNIMRAEQALEKKPDVIATSCPYCKIMLGSAINEKGVNDKVEVMDVMEIVAKGMDATPSAPA